jgi:hypothetical protein
MISRRTFARIAATAIAIPNLGIAAEEKAAANPEVEARIQWILTKYGSRLSEEQRADIRRIIASGQSGIDDMRKFELANGVGPAEPFRVYRKAAKK